MNVWMKNEWIDKDEWINKKMNEFMKKDEKEKWMKWWKINVK